MAMFGTAFGQSEISGIVQLGSSMALKDPEGHDMMTFSHDQIGIAIPQMNVQNLAVAQNLSVAGSLVSDLRISDNVVTVGVGNGSATSDSVDLGLACEYPSGGATKYAGLYRESSSGEFVLYRDLSTAPSANIALAGLPLASLNCGTVAASAVSVYKSGEAAPVSMSQASGGALSVNAPITAGTNAMTCGAVSCSSVDVSGRSYFGDTLFARLGTLILDPQTANNAGAFKCQSSGLFTFYGGSGTECCTINNGTITAGGNIAATGDVTVGGCVIYTKPFTPNKTFDQPNGSLAYHVIDVSGCKSSFIELSIITSANVEMMRIQVNLSEPYSYQSHNFGAKFSMSSNLTVSAQNDEVSEVLRFATVGVVLAGDVRKMYIVLKVKEIATHLLISRTLEGESNTQPSYVGRYATLAAFTATLTPINAPNGTPLIATKESEDLDQNKTIVWENYDQVMHDGDLKVGGKIAFKNEGGNIGRNLFELWSGGGAGLNYGMGIRSNEYQIFFPSFESKIGHLSFRKGGDIQPEGTTNELVRINEDGGDSEVLTVRGSGNVEGSLTVGGSVINGQPWVDAMPAPIPPNAVLTTSKFYVYELTHLSANKLEFVLADGLIYARLEVDSISSVVRSQENGNLRVRIVNDGATTTGFFKAAGLIRGTSGVWDWWNDRLFLVLEIQCGTHVDTYVKCRKTMSNKMDQAHKDIYQVSDNVQPSLYYSTDNVANLSGTTGMPCLSTVGYGEPWMQRELTKTLMMSPATNWNSSLSWSSFPESFAEDVACQKGLTVTGTLSAGTMKIGTVQPPSGYEVRINPEYNSTTGQVRVDALNVVASAQRITALEFAPYGSGLLIGNGSSEYKVNGIKSDSSTGLSFINKTAAITLPEVAGEIALTNGNKNVSTNSANYQALGTESTIVCTNTGSVAHVGITLPMEFDVKTGWHCVIFNRNLSGDSVDITATGGYYLNCVQNGTVTLSLLGVGQVMCHIYYIGNSEYFAQVVAI